MARRLPWSQARGNRFDGLGGAADFSYWQCYKGQGTSPVPKGPAEHRPDGPIAQLDRVTDFYSVGCRFESCWDRQCFPSTGFGTHEATAQTAEAKPPIMAAPKTAPQDRSGLTIDCRPNSDESPDRANRRSCVWRYQSSQEGWLLKARQLKQSKHRPRPRQPKSMHSASCPPESTMRLWEGSKFPPRKFVAATHCRSAHERDGPSEPAN